MEAVTCLCLFSKLLHRSLQPVLYHNFHYPKSTDSSPMRFTQINRNIISNFQLLSWRPQQSLGLGQQQLLLDETKGHNPVPVLRPSLPSCPDLFIPRDQPELPPSLCTKFPLQRKSRCMRRLSLQEHKHRQQYLDKT